MTSWVSKLTLYSETESERSVLDLLGVVTVLLTPAGSFGLFQNAGHGAGATAAGHLSSWSAMQRYHAKFRHYLDIKLIGVHSVGLNKHQ